MRTTVDDYSYVFIKLAVLKSLLMNSDELKKIKSFQDLETLSSFTRRYFPSFEINELEISEFERNLWKTYIDIEEKILLASPEPIRVFLKCLLVRYEIWNIKYAINAVIEDLDLDIKYTHIFKKPSVILEREEFIQNLIKAKSLDDIKKAVKKTPYSKIIENGLSKYEENGEIFYLEHELDKFFYQNLIDKSSYFPSREQSFMEQYIKSQIDFYNINILYRTFFNNIEMEEVRPYLILSGFLFKGRDILDFSNSASLDEFIFKLEKSLKNKTEIKSIVHELKNPDPRLWQNLSAVFLEDFLKRFQGKIMADISLMSISIIFKITLLKQIEIQEIIAKAVQITLKANE